MTEQLETECLVSEDPTPTVRCIYVLEPGADRWTARRDADAEEKD